ncbi:hypothetical protein [Rossellomorea marisflavi]|uniref:Uncharacterized protein n=1 Tax=Rossellomorea marisflavi TaxID=189381 RepID=A0A165L5Q1_9BACI|nr:hypothetical protein [Rossellomorea marisflavi]KZE51085.1 hypothetical protein AV649_17115 [Rossellomorea marisflavi]QHA35100.1 hypothetical protein D5E69_04260 [Rossellomorea marisflavi]
MKKLILSLAGALIVIAGISYLVVVMSGSGTDEKTTGKQEEKSKEKEGNESQEALAALEKGANKVTLGEAKESFEYSIVVDQAEPVEKIAPENPDNEIITLQGEVKMLPNENTEEGSNTDTPFALRGQIVIDENGEEYEAIQTTFVKKERWNNANIKPDGHIIFLKSFEIPKDTKVLYYKMDKNGMLLSDLLVDLEALDRE